MRERLSLDELVEIRMRSLEDGILGNKIMKIDGRSSWQNDKENSAGAGVLFEVLFAEDAYEALALLFLSRLTPEHLKDDSEMVRACYEMFVSLALQYDVEGPYRLGDIGWIEKLLDNIQTLTPYPELNNSILRRRLELYSLERFNEKLAHFTIPWSHRMPVRETRFEDKPER